MGLSRAKLTAGMTDKFKVAQQLAYNGAHEQLATETSSRLSRQVRQQLIGCPDQEPELYDC